MIRFFMTFSDILLSFILPSPLYLTNSSDLLIFTFLHHVICTKLPRSLSLHSILAMGAFIFLVSEIIPGYVLSSVYLEIGTSDVQICSNYIKHDFVIFYHNYILPSYLLIYFIFFLWSTSKLKGNF